MSGERYTICPLEVGIQVCCPPLPGDFSVVSSVRLIQCRLFAQLRCGWTSESESRLPWYSPCDRGLYCIHVEGTLVLIMMIDPTKASIGRDNVPVVTELLDSLAIWHFTEVLGWTAAQVHDLTRMARAEIEDATLKLYIPV